MMNKNRTKKVLAISSGGGHWVQLLRVRPAFMENEVVFVTVNNMYRVDIGHHKFYKVTALIVGIN